MLRLLVVPILIALPICARAQVAADPASEKGDIVVLGSPLALPPGTPAYGSTTIARARLTGDASGRVEDVLLDVAGFQQFRRSDSRSANPSAQGVTLRALGGNASSRALVLLDGVPIADPFFGYVPFNALSADRLEGVRVTRGGGTGAFGAGAVAGTIELASATRRNLPTIAGSAFAGSYGSRAVSVALSPDLGGGYVTLAGRWETSAGFFTTPDAARGGGDLRARFEDWSGSMRAVLPAGPETEIQAAALLFRDNRTLRFRGADSRSEGQDASIRLIHRGAWQVDAIAYVQARNFANRVISATSLRLTLDQRNTPSTGYGGKIELRPPVGPDHVLRFGADGRGAIGLLAEDAYSGVTGLVTARRGAGGANTTIGAFVEDDWTIGRLVLTGGARADFWTIGDGRFRELNAGGAVNVDRRFADRRGVEATGRVGALYRISPGVDVRGAAYTGFRLPTLNELYRPFVVFPITTQANAALEPERLRGVEVGVDFHPVAGASLGLTLFDNRLANAIANVTIAPSLRERRNIDAIEARGIEVTGALRHGATSLDLSYAYSDSRVRGSGAAAALDGFRPAQSPRHAASATLAWRPRGGSLSATVRYVGQQFEDDLQTDTLPAALTVDAVAGVRIARHASIVARAENLFDKDVVTRNSGGSIDLGTPRTLWIGLRIE